MGRSEIPLAVHSTKKIVVYSGLETISAADIRYVCGPSYNKDGLPYGVPAQGRVDVANEVIDVTRTNTDGRIEVILQRLGIGQNRDAYFLHQPEKAGRYLIFRFQAKCTTGSRTLRAVAIQPPPPAWSPLGASTCRVASPSWHSFELGFRISQTRDAMLRIDDQEASEVGSIQMSRLQVTEVTG
jgi:hypothetical protein